MKRWLHSARQVPLIARLRQINQAALAVALSVIAVVVIASSFLLNLRALVVDHQSSASVLAENLGATLLFNDKRAAQDMLVRPEQLPSRCFY